MNFSWLKECRGLEYELEISEKVENGPLSLATEPCGIKMKILRKKSQNCPELKKKTYKLKCQDSSHMIIS